MANTTNYNLKKPATTDYYNVADQNDNMDLIDAALKPTADPAQVPSGNIGILSQWVSWFANRIKAITGGTNWYDAPPITLTEADNLISNITAESIGAVPTARTVNGKALSANITLSASDVGAPTVINSFAASGYSKIGPLIIQWGSGATGATFPIAFPNACFSVANGANGNITSISNTGFTTTDRYGGSNTYIAVGY